VDWMAINTSTSGSSVSEIFSIAIDPITPTTLYTGTWDGWTPSGGSLYKSTNGGQSWSELNSGLPSSIVYSLVIDPVNPANVYSGSATGLFKSHDGGENWSEIDASLSNYITTALVLDPFTPTTLIAGVWDRGVFVYQQVDEK